MKRQLIRMINRVLAPLGARIEKLSDYRSSEPIPLREDSQLRRTREVLESQLEFIMLGSLQDTFSVPRNLVDMVRIFSLDGVAPGGATNGSTQLVELRKVVAAEVREVRFIQRKSHGVSSLLKPKTDLIGAYGLGDLYGVEREHVLEAVTLSSIADENDVADWDFVKTDLEGLDFQVVRSLGDRARNTSLIEMELRFEPFYDGEPYFHEVAAYLHDMGFEVLDLRPERWRAMTDHMRYTRRGRVVFCNATFVNRKMEHRSQAAIVRHAVVLGLAGYANFAERVLARVTDSEIVREIHNLLFGRASTEYLPYPTLPYVTHAANDW